MLQRIKFLIITAITIVVAVSCSTDFLEVEPKGLPLEVNYYKTEEEAKAGLIAVYDLMRKNSGGFENMITMFNAGSDDHFAGGGGPSDGAGIQSFSNYTIDANTVPRSFWSDYYRGIYRANILLQKLPDVPMDVAVKARFTAETKALRAFYYFNLVNMFKNVPLILTPLAASEIYTVTQAKPEDVYKQIELDLTSAISSLPATINKSVDGGRFTKGAAQALLGKVYLYQGKNALAATQFLEVNGTPGGVNQYGNRLLANFNDLWLVSSKFNTESLLEVSHSSQNSHWGIWGGNADEGNTVNVMVGPRSYSKPVGSPAPDLPSGWSFNVITQEFYDVIKTDPRFGATVLDLKALKAAGQASYFSGHMDTGYFLNKFIPRRSDVYSGGGDAVLNYKQNTYAIRLADTYLMEAEALGGTGARAQALLDAVRARIGLPSIPVSLNAIADERRLELAGEGFRFFDLVRTGKAAAELSGRGFVAGKNEIFPIPYRELENTKLAQNPNYN
ncbi:MAG: RagB/SusD family nutrient uptake outer membrane protein [Flavobacteriaceae bacterium]|nr:RagB/SusD family nutrient uptake outer membrane protein [Flavobacteriaceae bacterium]